MTFIHRFSRSVQCEMRVSDQPPATGTSHVQAIEWVGRLKAKHIPEYRQWILVVTQQLSNHWQAKILYCLGIKPDETEIWCFEPGKPPKLAQTLNIGIP
jgi:hypothetical protein